MKATFFVLVLVVVGTLAQPEAWKQLGRARSTDFISLRFALKQSNLDVLESTLLDVSNPTSANYGKWWTKDAILDLVAPPKEATQSVIAFLRQNGITMIEDHRDALKVTTTVAVAEELLQASLFYYRHINKPKKIIRTDEEYTIPEAIEQHVDLIAGLMEFPKLREQASQSFRDGVDGFIVPETINNLYQIPDNFPGHPNSSLCLAEFLNDQAYMDSDLQTFAEGVALPNITISHIKGNFSGSDLESTLDVEYGAAIGQNTTMWFWDSPNWMYEFANDVLNTPNPPLVISMSWGWPEPEQCHQHPPLANCSTFETSEQYVDRTNTEFQKLGLMGVTLLAASGDQGAPGDGDADCDHIFDHVLSSIFPGASPWVLSVGATMLTNSTSTNTSSPPICQQVQCATSTEEIVCTYPEALITSGGGFSDYVAMPSWQQNVVNAYLTSGVALPPSRDFKKGNRAFPDVSALGHNYLVVQEGQWEQVDGTSCSTPVWGAMIALLNSYRMNNGKSSLGFVVPLIYQAYAADPTTFNDITQGNNKCTEYCCDKYGYEATKGWDPVTGLGTPVFPKLLKYVASLP